MQDARPTAVFDRRFARHEPLPGGGRRLLRGHARLRVRVAAPAYLARLITLGSIAQIRIAYGQISASLSWFVFAYQEIARWRANVERLATLLESLDAVDQRIARPGIELVATDGGALRICDVRVEEPDGRRLLQEASATIGQGERVAEYHTRRWTLVAAGGIVTLQAA